MSTFSDFFEKHKTIHKLVVRFVIVMIVALLLIAGKKIYNWYGRDIDMDRSQLYLDSISPTHNKNLPNVIVILADDMGYGDLSAFGAQNISTPNIDALAEEGLSMDNFYASAAVCSPSRTGILTGRYPQRAHVPTVFHPKRSGIMPVLDLLNATSYGMPGISPDEVLIPEALSRSGYTTAIIGKWHLGDLDGYLPNDNGFSYFYGALYSNDQAPYEIYRNYDVVIPEPVDQNTLTKELTEEAVAFIETNKDQPFFLYYASPFPHYPAHASEDFQGSSQAGIYGDTVQEIDWSVGQIVNALETAGIEENTLVIVTSDNGPWFEGSTEGMRGRKGQIFDGGQRVPFVAWWPGTIPAGITSSEMAMNIDLFPTILDIADIPLPTDRIIDGRDLFPIMTGNTLDEPLHDVLYFINGKKVTAVRQENDKYMIRSGADNAYYWMIKQGPFLFDLTIYPSESYNLIDRAPKKAAELDALIQDMQNSLTDNLRGWIDTE